MRPISFPAPHTQYQQPIPPAFQGVALAPRQASQTIPALIRGMPKPSRMIRTFDFQDFAKATMSQIKLIYGMIIGSRVVAGSTRSKNEVREVLYRDPLGYAFWFFATPMIQRWFMKGVTPQKYKEAVFFEKPKPDGLLRRLNWRLNPLVRYDIPTSKQVMDRQRQATELIQTRLGQATEPKAKAQLQKALSNVDQYYKGVLKYRNLATGVGMAITIALLGVGINLLNIHLTNKRISEEGNPSQPRH